MVNANKRGFGFYVILLVNLLFLVAFVTTAVFLQINIMNEKRETTIQSFSEDVSAAANHFGKELWQENQYIDSHSQYIANHELTEDQAAEYLKNWALYYSEIDMVCTSTYRTISITSAAEPSAINVKARPWIADVVKLKKEGNIDYKRIRVTNRFANLNTKDFDIALYSEATIEGQDYILFFVRSLTNLRDECNQVAHLKDARTVIVDTNHNVVAGDISGLDRNEVLACVSEDIPFTDSWSIQYYVMKEDTSFNSTAKVLTVFILIFLFAWLLMDAIIYIWYNNKLRKAFEVVSEKNEELKHASDAKTNFVSSVSHELRTPINAVLGMDEMIINETTDEKIRGYAIDIQNAGRMLLEQINDVLDFAKIESGKMDIINDKYNLVEVIKELYNMIFMKATAKYILFDVEVPYDLPSILIGDEVRMRQIIINLLTNAVKYTNEGSILLTISSEKSGPDTVDITIAVKDTGIGMKEEDMDHLLDEFSRFDTVKNKNIEGTGLGLPIVAKLLDRMNSKLEVESVYGLGSMFHFTVRQQVADWTPVRDVDFKKKEKAAEPTPHKTFSAADKNILVVDDTEMNIKVVQGLLKDTGMTIDAAPGGMRSLAMCQDKKYDLILLDHRMPKMDGIETIHKLQSEPGPNKETPVIALTANVVTGAREYYISEGFVDFLAKPVSNSVLHEAISKYLGVDLSIVEAPNSKENGEQQANTGHAVSEAAAGAVASSETVNVNKPASTKTVDDVLKSVQEAPIEKKIKKQPNVSEIDKEKAKEFCDTDELFFQILDVFVEQVPELTENIKKAYSDRDATAYNLYAHSIKSSARTIGATRLFDIAYELEMASKEGEWFVIDRRHNSLLARYEKVKKEAIILGQAGQA